MVRSGWFMHTWEAGQLECPRRNYLLLSFGPLLKLCTSDRAIADHTYCTGFPAGFFWGFRCSAARGFGDF